jgi:hypothetical protein
MRVIVTGSRAWPDPLAVAHELNTLYLQHGPYVLVHGACATGADAAAAHWMEAAGRDLGVTEVRFPADWEQYGKRAGPLRNEQMVKAGADLVLAFPLPGGSGTQHTVSLARLAEIEVRVIKA